MICPGERLWFALRDWWFDDLGAQVGSAGLVSFDWLDGEGRSGQALTYIAISDACTRIARRADRALTQCMSEGFRSDQFRETIINEVKQYCVMPRPVGR